MTADGTTFHARAIRSLPCRWSLPRHLELPLYFHSEEWVPDERWNDVTQQEPTWFYIRWPSFCACKRTPILRPRTCKKRHNGQLIGIHPECLDWLIKYLLHVWFSICPSWNCKAKKLSIFIFKFVVVLQILRVFTVHHTSQLTTTDSTWKSRSNSILCWTIYR